MSEFLDIDTSRNKIDYFWAMDDWRVVAVGSRVTCDPPPQDTDIDYLCYARDIHRHERHLKDIGFSQDGTPEFYTGNNNGNFKSWRKGKINLILTDEEDFFDLFITASTLAKRFNLLSKPDRIALFQAILYGVNVDHLSF